MAKQHRATMGRSARTKPKTAKKAAPAASRSRRAATTVGGTAAVQASAPRGRTPVESVAPVPKKPAYYEAIAVYETGVRALQRHDFTTAAEHFRTVLDRYPEERELVERATLYLRVCERETANRATGPGTPRERIYAATVALNAGDAESALQQLRQALSLDPENDHGHYIMAVALSERGDQGQALNYLRQAISLNPDNRSLARQDPDLAVLRETEAARQLLESPSAMTRRRPSRARR